MIVLRGRWGLKLDKYIFRKTGYSLITKQYALARGERYQPTLMLTTIGARSSRLRNAVLPYSTWRNELVVVGSNGGGPTDPSWVHNVRASPLAWVRIGRKDRPARARVAQGEERAQLFEELSRYRSSVPRYQDMCAPRELPLVILSPHAATTFD